MAGQVSNEESSGNSRQTHGYNIGELACEERLSDNSISKRCVLFWKSYLLHIAHVRLPDLA
jgi:hypothetical protein